MQILLTTTGTPASFNIKGLSEFVHPVVDQDLLATWNIERLRQSEYLQSAIDAEECTLKDENGVTLTSIPDANVLKNDFGATGVPGPNEDETQGYSVGSKCVVNKTDEYTCLDNATAAAIWQLSSKKGFHPLATTSNPTKNDAAFAVVPEMTQTVPALFSGSLAVHFLGIFKVSNANTSMELSIFVDGVEQTAYTLTHNFPDASKAYEKSCIGLVAGLTGGEVITIQWKRASGQGTVTAFESQRVLLITGF